MTDEERIAASHTKFALRFDPWKKLEEFEQKHGDHGALIGKLTHDEERNKEVERLLRCRDKLVWMCMAFNAGFEQGREQGRKEAGA